VTGIDHLFPGSFNHFLGIGARRAVGRAVHAGSAAQEGLGYFLGYGKLSFHYLLDEDHLSPGIGDGSFGEVENGTDCPAKTAAGALSDGLALLFIELELSGHHISLKQ
jgi:hypothetical protein